MGLLSEDRKEEGLALTLDVADNVTMSKLSPFGPAGLVFPSRQHTAAARWISELAIKCAGPFQKAGELSGGNQQKIAIARLLHHDVDILVLDEPTRGIDVGSKAQIYRLIDALVADAPDHQPRAVLMKAIWDAGLRVPDDIAIVGAGDIALGDLLRVPLTTVSWSRDEQGKLAAKLLLDRIGPEPSDQFRSVVIPPHLIVRRSSAGE